jgi:hypothetical protein
MKKSSVFLSEAVQSVYTRYENVTRLISLFLAFPYISNPMSPIYRKLLKSVAKAISIPTLTPTFIPI